MTDFHIHSNFSTDAPQSSTPESIIQKSIKLGLNTICFTDHHDEDYPSDEREFTFDTDEYFETLENLQKKYCNQIDIRIGVEIGLQPFLREHYRAYTHQYPFDFVIGSVHVVKGMDPYHGIMFEGRSDEEAYEETFRETIENIKAIEDFDVLGHLDYVVRYGKEKAVHYSYSKFASSIDEILRVLIEKGKGIEINTSGYKYGLGFCHPQPIIIKRYKELGGEIITIGSDAHKPEHIAYDFYKVSDILKDCGFKYFTEFKERIPIFKQLK